MKNGNAIISQAASWVLRIGVGLSVAFMLAGVSLSLLHHNLPLSRMQTAKFEADPRVIWRGVCALSGQAVIEVGVYLLVLTPIMRVATSMVLFAVVDRDWVYTVITAISLVLTLVGLILLK